MDKHNCPCGSGLSYGNCCAPFLSGNTVPPTAETLMRSRYTAYVQQDEGYLLHTWHRSTRPANLLLEEQPPTKWLGLKIVRTAAGGPADTHGIVEFIARYKVTGKAERLHETSEFIKENGRWLYLGGEIDQ